VRGGREAVQQHDRLARAPVACGVVVESSATEIYEFTTHERGTLGQDEGGVTRDGGPNWRVPTSRSDVSHVLPDSRRAYLPRDDSPREG
jgi:hypothetical protein